jgi:hypothetical protein
MKYLGAPVSRPRVRIRELSFVEERSLKLLDGWQRGSMSLAGRIFLIYSSLNWIYNYCMSMFNFLVTFSENLVKIQRRFFWQGRNSARKYRTVKWQILCRPKDKGVLGIKNIDKMNINLLCKLLRKIENDERFDKNSYKKV